MLWNLPHVIPGLTGNLSKQSAAKSPFYALNRGRCHFTNPCLSHFRPPEADFVPDHSGRAKPFVIPVEPGSCHSGRAEPLVVSTERQRVEKSCTSQATFLPIIVPPSVLQHAAGNVSSLFCSLNRAKGKYEQAQGFSCVQYHRFLFATSNQGSPLGDNNGHFCSRPLTKVPSWGLMDRALPPLPHSRLDRESLKTAHRNSSTLCSN